MSPAVLATVGLVIGGLFVVIVLPFAQRLRGAQRWLYGGAVLVAGWGLARAAGWGAGLVLASAAEAVRPEFAAALWPASGGDTVIFALFLGLALLMTGAVARARRGGAKR